jgi:DNA-binding transcriptional ArsR family regulator
MKGESPNMSAKEMAQIRKNLEGSPGIEETAELMNLAGNSTRLKLLYLLENEKELQIGDLSEILGVSVSATSQHLAKLKAVGLVEPRHDAQTVYFRLTDHSFNGKMRDHFFGPIPYCFPAWTRVTTGGGADRPISELRTGDLVLSWNGHQEVVAQGRVERVITGKATLLVRINGGLMASPEHRILTARGFLQFDAVEAGDQVNQCSGAGIRIQEVRQIEVFHGETPVYNLDVGPSSSFFAEGLAVEDFTGEVPAEEVPPESLRVADSTLETAARGRA